MGHKNSPIPDRTIARNVGSVSEALSFPEHSNEDVLMKQYQTLVDTYKTYLDLILKFVLFSYAVTGGIVSYCLAQAQQNRTIKFGLLFPIVMNASFAGLCFLGASRVKPLTDEVERVTNELKLSATPDIQFLAWVLSLLGCLFVLISVGLIIPLAVL